MLGNIEIKHIHMHTQNPCPRTLESSEGDKHENKSNDTMNREECGRYYRYFKKRSTEFGKECQERLLV